MNGGLIDVDVIPAGKRMELRRLPRTAEPDGRDAQLVRGKPHARGAQPESWVETVTGLRVRGRAGRGRFRRSQSTNLGSVLLTPAEGYAITAEPIPGMPDMWVVAAVPQVMFVSSTGSAGAAAGDKGANAGAADDGSNSGGTANAGFWVQLGVGIGKALSGIVKGFADLFPKLQKKRQRNAQQQQAYEDERERELADLEAQRETDQIMAMVDALNARNAEARQVIEAEAEAGSAGCARCNGTCGDRYGMG